MSHSSKLAAVSKGRWLDGPQVGQPGWERSAPWARAASRKFSRSGLVASHITPYSLGKRALGLAPAASRAYLLGTFHGVSGRYLQEYLHNIRVPLRYGCRVH